MKLFLILSFVISAYAADCFLPSQTCFGKCCSGTCQAASCTGNDLVIQPGHESECVLTKQNVNQGGRCPWTGQAYGIKCSFSADCVQNKNNNCYGKTVCASGVCPTSALDLFCLESGASDNFKICGCDDLDCVVSGWSDWGPCVGNIQTKTRTIVTSQSGNGLECPVLSQTQSCGDVCDNIIKTKSDFYVAYYNKKLIGASVLKNDQNVISVSLESSTQNGQLTFNPDGTFVYTPTTNYCGSDTFIYKAINNDCYAMQEVVITTTCGCGTLVDSVTCMLDLTQTSTQCQLPNGKVVTVANLPGYTKVILNISAKTTYKKK